MQDKATLTKEIHKEKLEENYKIGENLSLTFFDEAEYIGFSLIENGKEIISMMVDEKFKEQIIARYQSIPTLLTFLKSSGITATQIARHIETSLNLTITTVTSKAPLPHFLTWNWEEHQASYASNMEGISTVSRTTSEDRIARNIRFIREIALNDTKDKETSQLKTPQERLNDSLAKALSHANLESTNSLQNTRKILDGYTVPIFSPPIMPSWSTTTTTTTTTVEEIPHDNRVQNILNQMNSTEAPITDMSQLLDNLKEFNEPSNNNFIGSRLMTIVAIMTIAVINKTLADNAKVNEVEIKQTSTAPNVARTKDGKILLNKMGNQLPANFLTELGDALVNDDPIYFEQLVSSIDVDTEFPGGTCLDLAVRKEKFAIVQMLIQKNANVNHSDKYHGTYLIQAAYKNNLEIMKVLLEAGAEINFIAPRLKAIMFPGHTAGTALHVAASKGFMEAAKLLIDNGADINSQKIPDKDSKCQTPFDIAIREYNPDLFALFMAHKDNLTVATIEHALFVAFETANEEYVLQLIELLKEKNSDSEYILIGEFVLSVVHNNLIKAEKLAPNLSIKINKLNWGCLDELINVPAKSDNLEMLKLLESMGANLHREGFFTVFESAADYNAVRVLVYLVSQSPSLKNLNKALGEAVICGHLDSVKLLVEAGANINCKSYGISNLALALYKGHHQIADYLISKGARAYLSGYDSQLTAFHIALLKGDMKLAISLIKSAPKLLNIKNVYSYRKPVDEWVYKNLIEDKIEHNDYTLSVILVFAILAEDQTSVQQLIKHGADIHAKVYAGQSAYELSRKCSESSIYEIISDADKAGKIGDILSHPKLSSSSLIFMAAKASAKHVLKRENNHVFFHNIPDKFADFVKDDIQKVILIASDHENGEFEQEDSVAGNSYSQM